MPYEERGRKCVSERDVISDARSVAEPRMRNEIAAISNTRSRVSK